MENTKDQNSGTRSSTNELMVLSKEDLVTIINQKNAEIDKWRGRAEQAEEQKTFAMVEVKVGKSQIADITQKTKQKSKQVDFVLSQLAKEKQNAEELSCQVANLKGELEQVSGERDCRKGERCTI